MTTILPCLREQARVSSRHLQPLSRRESPVAKLPRSRVPPQERGEKGRFPARRHPFSRDVRADHRRSTERSPCLAGVGREGSSADHPEVTVAVEAFRCRSAWGAAAAAAGAAADAAAVGRRAGVADRRSWRDGGGRPPRVPVVARDLCRHGKRGKRNTPRGTRAEGKEVLVAAGHTGRGRRDRNFRLDPIVVEAAAQPREVSPRATGAVAALVGSTNFGRGSGRDRRCRRRCLRFRSRRACRRPLAAINTSISRSRGAVSYGRRMASSLVLRQGVAHPKKRGLERYHRTKSITGWDSAAEGFIVGVKEMFATYFDVLVELAAL